MNIPDDICKRFVTRLMDAQDVFAATADPEPIRECLAMLEAYRSCWRGERSEEEMEADAARAIERLDAWSTRIGFVRAAINSGAPDEVSR